MRFSPDRRRVVVSVGLCLLLLTAVLTPSTPVWAGEYDDARVAFGAFQDGIYAFARRELDTFLKRYPESKLHDRACLLLALCCLEGEECQAAADYLDRLKEPAAVAANGLAPAHLNLQLGLCFKRKGEAAKAEARLLEVLKAKGQAEWRARSRYELAGIYFARPDYAALVRVSAPLLPPKRTVAPPGLSRKEWGSLVEMAALADYRKQDYAAALPLFQFLLSGKPVEVSRQPALLQDYYGLAVECAWHAGRVNVVFRLLEGWQQTVGKKLDLLKLSTVLLQVYGEFRKQGKLPQLKSFIKVAVAGKLPAEEKLAHYRILVEIARQQKSTQDLRLWLARLSGLEKPGSPEWTNHLRLRLQLEFQAHALSAVIELGRQLEQTDKRFWSDERFYYPYLLALQRKGRCRDLVERVPVKLPAVSPSDSAAAARRLALEMAAGDCLIKLERWPAAVALYRKLYGECRRADAQLRCLAVLARLSSHLLPKKQTALQDWLAGQLIASFPLDCSEHEKYLRSHPELVYLVADHFFRRGEYKRCLPSLLWLEKNKFTNPPAQAAIYLLAETYYRMGDLSAALPRYWKLFRQPPGLDRYRHPAALRLIVCYDRLKLRSKEQKRQLIAICHYLLQSEKDPAMQRELRRKLKKLHAQS